MAAINLSLHPSQYKVFTDPTRFKVVVAGRRWGKSRLAAVTALTEALNPLNVKKKPVFIIGPTYQQTKTIYWADLMELGKEVIESVRINEGEIRLINGVTIYLRGSDREDTLRGLGLWFAVLDEVQDMKSQVWSTIIRPTLSDVQGRALLIFTPKGHSNWTYGLWTEAEENKSGEWAAFHFKTSDNPYILESEVESARASMSSQAFEQEFEASFVSGSTQLFNADWFKYSSTEPKDGNWFITVDLAGFSNETSLVKHHAKLDQHAISVVKVHKEGWWVKEVQHGKWGVREAASRIVSLYKQYEPQALGIEKGSLHNAVLPYLQEEMDRQRCYFSVTPLSHNNRSKTERIVWALQGRCEHGRLVLNPGAWNAVLTDELLNLGAKNVHDDAADSLAYIAQICDSVVIDLDSFDFQDMALDIQDYQPLSARAGY